MEIVGRSLLSFLTSVDRRNNSEEEDPKSESWDSQHGSAWERAGKGSRKAIERWRQSGGFSTRRQSGESPL